jgi:hypothetical protein
LEERALDSVTLDLLARTAGTVGGVSLHQPYSPPLFTVAARQPAVEKRKSGSTYFHKSNQNIDLLAEK